MNLYKITVKHLSQKDSHTSIEKYEVAENESELYDKLIESGRVYWDEKDSDWAESNIPDYELGDKSDEEFEQDLKNFIISTKGEVDSDWACYDDLYYGKTHYGWELVKENVSDLEIEILKSLNIIV